MKVIYDSYLRRNRSNASHGSNNNNNGHNIEICHPTDYSKNGSNQRESTAYSLAGPNCRHMISYESLVINKELGIGEFGVVQQGVWTNDKGCRIQVAIKCLSAARLENNRLEFLKEASIMHSISHEHIVALYGVVLEPSIMLVTELAPLRSMLECLKESALISHFPVSSLCTFAAQIADGMDYLESKRLIHRDLAARNILVFSKDKVKISDFGLSRALGVGKDYYQSNFNVNLKLPIAWCAPECINYLKFTSQSDVWAYGVTLWEMFSFGFQPWAALTGQQILEAIDKPNYQRLEQPECCPKEYYQLMLKCWTHEPHLRPKFSEIVHLQPDCKPELLRAIRNSVLSGSQKEFLQYKIGDIITVIDKSSESQETSTSSYWKGVTNERKTGFFNPSDFVTYLGQNLPSSNNANSSSSTSFVQHFLSGSSLSSNSSNGHHSNNHHHHSSFASTITSTVLQSSKFIRGLIESKSHHNNHVSPHGTRKKSVRPEISKPQGDFKHTGHVGADGIFFGDIPFMEGKYQQAPRHSASSSLDGNDPMSKSLAISHPIASFGRNNSTAISNKQLEKYLEENHEYHEISDEDDLGPLESPPFEVMDFGPSLMEEVFRELDQIKPELNNETGETETAINENGINVKNEVRELNLKICKDANNLKKKQSSVKPISEAEQNELDSAIAMAKDIANRTMLEDELDLAKSDSPKTPNSPNKRKFSFKFPSHKSSPKGERRTFSQETESIGNIIESITPAAKEAYLSLVEKGVSSSTSNSSSFNKKEHFDKRPDVKPPPPPQAPQPPTIAPLVIDPSSGSMEVSNLVNEMDNNPLRMLRTAGIGKVLRPKVRGNRSFSQPRLPTTAQTAGLARVASSRSQLGSPPPVPNHEDQSSSQFTSNNNALPLPPRDRTRPLIQLKTHQRRHPLVIPGTGLNGNSDSANGYSTAATSDDLNYDAARHDSPPLVHRHVPVLKQVSCPQAPAAFLSVYNKQTANNAINNANNCSSFTNNDCDRPSAAIPPSKPNRTYLSDDLTESLENEIQKAFDNIKLSQSVDNIADDNISDNEDSVQTNPKCDSTESAKPVESSNMNKVSTTTNDNNVKLNHSTLNGSQTTIQSSSNNTQNPQNGVHSISNGNSCVTANAISVSDSNPNVRPSPVSNLVNNNSSITNEPAADLLGTTTTTTTGNHKRSIDSDEVRVMQKVLGNEANLSVEECATILDTTDWDIHKAIKCVRFRHQLHSHNINVDCDLAQMLAKFNWNTRQASNYLIATQGVPEDTTEV